MANPSLQTLLAQLQQWGEQGGKMKASPYDLSSAYLKSGEEQPTAQPSEQAGSAQPQGAWAKLGQLLAPQTMKTMGGASKGGGTSVG